MAKHVLERGDSPIVSGQFEELVAWVRDQLWDYEESEESSESFARRLVSQLALKFREELAG